MTPAWEIARLLELKGLVTLGGTADWAAFVSHLPDSPDRAIVFFDTGGPGADPKFNVEEVYVRMTVRGSPYNYAEAFSKAHDIVDALVGHDRTDVNGTVILGIWNSGGPSSGVLDERNRPHVTAAFRIYRIPPKTSLSNRSDL